MKTMAATVAILKMYFELLLLTERLNWSGTQVSYTGSSWPSCLIFLTREKTFVLIYTPDPSGKGSTLKGNKFAPIVSKFSPLE